jgi:hypothetical protein
MQECRTIREINKKKQTRQPMHFAWIICTFWDFTVANTALAVGYKHILYWFNSTDPFTKVYQLWNSQYTLQNSL